MSKVVLSQIRKSFGDVEVIHGVDFTVDEGEFVALVGPSGCGKSTLLRMIAGLETITSGDVRIADRVVNDLDPKQRNIAMVFQNYALYPHMTVRQNISLNLRISRVDKAEIKQRVERVAKLLHLEEYLERKPEQLSGGQRQRVAMGRAIVRDPAVFLFDEPLSNLDAKLRVQMRAEIKALHQNVQTTSIYVTHDQIEAMTLAQRIVVLNNGRIEQAGTPVELYERPANQFVAGFIGSPSMNFLNATVGDGSDGLMPVFIDGVEIVRVQVRDRLSPGDETILGIRPEHIAIEEDAGVPAEVLQVEPTGAQTFLLLSLHGQPVTAVVAGIVNPPVGATVRIEPDIEKVHLFASDSTERIAPKHEAGKGAGSTREA